VRLSSLACQQMGGYRLVRNPNLALSAAQAFCGSRAIRNAGLQDGGCACLHFPYGLADCQSGGFISTVSREANSLLWGELRALGLPVDHIDVGGGLGVDYDGHSTHVTPVRSITNVNEYAHTVVAHVAATSVTRQGLRSPHIFPKAARSDDRAYHGGSWLCRVTDG